MMLEVVLDPIVVQEGVVDIDQEDDRSWGHDVASVDAPARAEARVRFFSESKPGADSISSLERQRQLPSALPGRFMRASSPRLRTSCSGAIASAAADDHASPSSAGATSAALPSARFR